MENTDYISSGLLELYVAGSLTELESAEVAEAIERNPLLAKEVEQIEYAFCKLSEIEAPDLPNDTFLEIIQNIDSEPFSAESEEDIEDLMSSGVLELYVAGVLSDDENIRITALSEKDADVKAEIERIEAIYIQMSIVDTPPLDELGFFDILDSINETDKQTSTSSKLSVVANNTEDQKEWEDVKLKKHETIGFMHTYGHYLAAAIVILMVSAGANFFMMGELEKVNEQMAVLDQNAIETINGIPTSTSHSSDRKHFMKNPSPNTLEVLLLPTKKSMADMEVKIYWNHQVGTTHIDASKLPVPPEGKQWQVWAGIPNVANPYNLGLLSNMKTDQDNFFKLRMLQKEPDSFLVTLEPTGGSLLPSPNHIYLKTNKKSRNI